jgi:hypothetical protein
MLNVRNFFFAPTLVLLLLFPTPVWSDETRPADLPPDEDILAFAYRAEGSLISSLHKATPLGEAYFQRFIPAEKLGLVVDSDRYFLTRFTWTTNPALQDLLNYLGPSATDAGKSTANPQLLEGLLQVMVPDWQELTPDRYDFSFVGRDFLDTIRCLIYDVRPKNPEDRGFAGRIFLEDKTFAIVRFTGRSASLDRALAELREKDSRFEIDSWRMNVAPNRWYPAYSYLEEIPAWGAKDSPIVRGQVRFWGYDRTATEQQQRVDVFLNDSPSAANSTWRSPLETQRMYENQAEENILARLFQARFLGAPGEVEAMLDQVLTNLVAKNNLVLSQPMRCRILLTTRLEAFSVGRTIVLSRGLVDVLPSESAIALVLAHQLAHNVLGHPKVDNRFVYSDVLRISDQELLAKLRFRRSPSEEAEADDRAMEILEKSPYQSAMNDGGLFMQAIQARMKQLAALIVPAFGEDVADTQHLVSFNRIFLTTPVRNEHLIHQVGALPLGAKLIVSPWDGHIEIFRSTPALAQKLYERAELAVTPFVPRLEYFAEKPIASKPQVTAGKRRSPRTTPSPNRAVGTPTKLASPAVAAVRPTQNGR